MDDEPGQQLTNRMKIFSAIILTALLSFIACLYLPWWTIAIVSFFVMALLRLRPVWSFVAGFAALFLLWTVLALVIDLRNEHILSARMALVLPLGGSSTALILVTGFIGGIAAGVAGLAAGFLRNARS
jgi:hypothetical protein